MATGYASNGVCFENPIDAQIDYYTRISPVTYYDPAPCGNISCGLPGQQVVMSYSFDWGSQVPMLRIRTLKTGQFVEERIAEVTAFPSCLAPSEQFSDGLVVGGGLLLAVISAVIFGIISKAK